ECRKHERVGDEGENARERGERPRGCPDTRWPAPREQQDADVACARREHHELEVDHWRGMLDAARVDQGVGGDARRDGNAEPGPAAPSFCVTAAAAADEKDSDPYEANSDGL